MLTGKQFHQEQMMSLIKVSSHPLIDNITIYRQKKEVKRYQSDMLFTREKENFLKTADTYIKFMEEILLKGMWHTYMQMVKS